MVHTFHYMEYFCIANNSVRACAETSIHSSFQSSHSILLHDKLLNKMTIDLGVILITFLWQAQCLRSAIATTKSSIPQAIYIVLQFCDQSPLAQQREEHAHVIWL